MHRRLLAITFIESLSTILLERGIYFYTEGRLGFSPTENLLLALAFGCTYVAGAQMSHAIAVRAGERKALMGVIAMLMTAHFVTAIAPTAGMMWVVMALTAFGQGAKWPILESYVSAGQTPTSTAKVIGQFNIAWSSAVPVALFLTGQLIEAWEPLVFILAGSLNVVTFAVAFTLPAQPTHLAHDHPDRLTPHEHERYKLLLGCARWTMMSSFTLLFVLGPLMPEIFRNRLGFTLVVATTLSGLLDVMRLTAFVIMQRWIGWHGMAAPLAVALVVSPISFFMVLLGPDALIVLSGCVMFGLSAGVIYASAIYYAMVVHDAAVDAGGAHEALIGTGFALGPAVGLLGLSLKTTLGSAMLGMFCGIGPIVFLTVGAGARPLLALARHKTDRALADPLAEPPPHIHDDQAHDQ